MVLTWRLRSRLDPRPSGGGAERRVGRLRRCCDRLSRGTSGPRYIKAHAAVRTAVGRLVVPTRRCEAAGTVAEHPTNVSSALRTWESPGECCPSHEAHGAYGYRQTTCVGLEWQQRRERETEKGNRNQGRVRPQHAPPEPPSDRFSRAQIPLVPSAEARDQLFALANVCESLARRTHERKSDQPISPPVAALVGRPRWLATWCDCCFGFAGSSC